MSTITALELRPIGSVDLAAERAALGPALEDAVLRVLRSGVYVLGPEVVRLEQDFARFQRVAHAGIGVANGTDALIVAMKALGVKPGDHVVTSPFTFFSSAASIAWIGATPKLADVELDTALLDPRATEAAIDAKTTCILPVHLYGQLADMRAFRALADARRLTVLEDGAQCHGAERDGARCGELGDAAAFSFYPTKNLGACGEGGMILSRRADVLARAKRLRDHGSPVKYSHAEIGTNSRLQGIQGAVLNVKLPHLERWNARRRAVAARYDAAFSGVEELAIVRAARGSTHVYHQYAVRVTGRIGRDAVSAKLAEEKITTAVHYPTPVHFQEAAREWGYAAGAFPNAERLAREVLCVPIHPFLSDADVERVIRAVTLAVRGSA